MKIDVFRSVNFWKSACISMTDNSFFELMRSVFGKIKTPFKKQQLLDDLETFLLRDDIQKTIASYIDENDAKIITAIALFCEQTGSEPALEQLENFFCDEFSSAWLQDIIVNMEERFILYRFTEEKTVFSAENRCLALNPVLKSVLLPFTTDTSILFPIDKAAASPAQACQTVLNEQLLTGLFSFASQWESFFRSEDTTKSCSIRKRVKEAGKTCFPGVDLEYVIGCLLVLGLFYMDTEKLVPDKKRFDDFALLSARERSEYCAAAILIYNELNLPIEILSPLFRNKIREITGLIHGFIDSLNPKILYPAKTLKRMIKIIFSNKSAGFNADKLLEALEKTALIVNDTGELKQLGAIIQNNTASKYDKPVIAIDSGFSILVYPEINFTDAVALASFLNIRETGAPFARFELDRDAAVRAFDNNISADEIIELLNRLICKKACLQASDKKAAADDALIWNLKDWEKRHGEVSLKKGIILSLSEEHRYLTETLSLAALIIEPLAPGLYLLDENASERAIDALRSAGIDIIARRKNSQAARASSSSHFPTLITNPAFNCQLKTTNAPLAFKTEKNSSALTEKFQAILEKMSLNNTDRAELSARIDRRLLLCETQLREAHIRYEKLEARHMDYAGKQLIAKQAISQQSPVEIVRLGSNGEKIFGIPKALEKEGNELFLLIDNMRIPLAKISLLRRIKRSIFEK